MLKIEYRPSSFVTAVRTCPVWVFVAVILTPGITAPLSSFVVPERLAFASCAVAAGAQQIRQTKIKTAHNKFLRAVDRIDASTVSGIFSLHILNAGTGVNSKWPCAEDSAII
jgi:hypothetical protein